jgi:hypothetical protein
MANCPPSGCYEPWSDIGELELCPSRRTGGINAAILFKCGVEIEDITVDEDLDLLDNEKIEALITSGDARLVQGIQVTLNAPSAITAATGDPCNPESAVNYDRSLTWQDFNVNRQRGKFYNSINAVQGFPLGGVLLNHCEADTTTLILGNVKFSGDVNSPENNTENMRYEFEVTWRQKNNVELFEQSLDAFA